MCRRRTGAASKSSQTAFLFGKAPKSRSTRRLSAQPGVTAAPALELTVSPAPELQRARRCKLVVFGVELGGRISRSTLTFLRLLGRAKACQRARCGGSASACAAMDGPRLVSRGARARVLVAGAARGRVARRPPGWRGGPVGRPFGGRGAAA